MGLDAARAAWAIFQRLAILVRAEVAHGAQRPCLVITLATLISFLSYSLRMALIENSTLSAQLHRVGLKCLQLQSSMDPAATQADGTGITSLPLDKAPVGSSTAGHVQQPQAAVPYNHPKGGLGWRGENEAHVRKICGTRREGPFYMQELVYPRGSYLDVPKLNDPGAPNAIKTLLSVNNPQDDHVVSKGILNWLYSPGGTYPSLSEVHTLCTAVPSVQPGNEDLGMLGAFNANWIANKDGPLGEPLVTCEAGKVAVEVGSAVGMVSMYLVERGMRVFALDPVLPNVQRMRESACANGVRLCMRQHAAMPPDATAAKCGDEAMWGNYAPANFTLIYAVADRATEKPRLVQAVAGNLAATDASKTATARGPTQAWSGSVPTLALDDILEDGAAEVELLHMCPQGDESRVLQGAMRLIEQGRVKNILFGLYQSADPATRKAEIIASLHVAELLKGLGYSFYDMDRCGRANSGQGSGVATGPPVAVPYDKLQAYLSQDRKKGWHAMMLAALGPEARARLRASAGSGAGGAAGGSPAAGSDAGGDIGNSSSLPENATDMGARDAAIAGAPGQMRAREIVEMTARMLADKTK